MKEATPTTNYGTGTTLQVDAGTGVRVNTYLRFTLTGLSGTIQSAKLRLLSNSDGTTFGPSVYAAASGTWIESGTGGITWSNQPGTTGPGYGGGSAVPANTWAEWDVKPLVSGNGTYNFVLVTPNTDGVYFISKEGAAGSAPQLVVTTGLAGDTQAPSAPGNLSANATSPTQIDLNWTASTDNVGVTGYDIYRWSGSGTPKPNPLPPPIATAITATTYSDKTAAASSTYNYVVEARDAANNASADSNTATATTPAASTTVTAVPSADAKVQEASAGSNFATTTLQADAGSGVRVNSYLRFTLNGLSGPIQSAKLRLLATSDGTSFGPSVSATTGGWSETGITWSSQPGPTGPAYGGATAMPPNTWAEWDVKPLITGNGTYNFVLTTPNTDGIFFVSREGASPPQLVVAAGSGGGGGGGDSQPPSPPSNLVASAVSSSQINLSWTQATDNVGVIGYDLYRNGTFQKTLGTGTSYSDTGLLPSTNYSYYLIARDGAGNLSTPSNTASASTQPSGGGGGDPTIGAAGDIACDPTNGSFNSGNGTSGNCRQKYTSDLLVGGGYSAVLDLGDNQYYCGGYTAFTQSYDLSWGRVKSITHPSVGNHEYLTSGGTGCDSSNAGAAGYFKYFGSAAGQQGKGYYSYDVGSWHLIALNSNCGDAGGCSSGSAQYTWLQNDLNTHTNKCVLAYWHIPLYSSGGRAASNTQPFWTLLYNANADVILSAHDHVYERFAPQNASAGADSARGIREFIVGTGGANHTSFASTAANSVVRDSTTYGVLKLTLHSSSYDWQFVRDAGSGSFTDSGSGACH